MRTRYVIGLAGAALLVLGLVVIQVMRSVPNESRGPESQTMDILVSVAGALEFYRQDRGDYPSEVDGLVVLASAYLPESALVDGWGRPLSYELLDDRGTRPYKLCSGGQNAHIEGEGSDDLCFSP